MPKLEITDRYQAMGIPYPDPETMCKGQCEGTGVIPVFMDNPFGYGCRPNGEEKDEQLIALWKEAEAENPTDDGWHFVKCPACGGTGIEQGEEDGS